ncbi:hypothetical protein [Lentilactobacillus hilgardii]|uniref:hypothetical protein n=1 Tax=Lentilactobacillus hilgardii TaxID=1588 RepID=UPI003FA60D55
MVKDDASIKSHKSDQLAGVKRTFSLFGSVVSKLLGENTYAKSTIYSERIIRGAHSSLNHPLNAGLSLAEFKMAKSSQLGYLAAVKDLMTINFNQFSFMIAWATGEETPEIVNQATGRNYAAYLGESRDERQFTLGYQTAVIHFVQAISGEGGFLPTIMDRLAGFSIEEASQMADAWFSHINRYLRDVSPYKKLTATSDSHIVKGMINEYDSGFLTQYQISGRTLFQYSSDDGPDFSDQHDLPPIIVRSLADNHLKDAVRQFIKRDVTGLIDLMVSVVLYAICREQLTVDNYDLLGIPALMTSTDRTAIASSLEMNETIILLKMGIPATIVKSAEKMAILDLSDVAHTRNADNQNFQQIFSYVLGPLHKPIINDFHQKIEIDYGTFDQLFTEMLKKLLLPLLLNYSFARNRALLFARQHLSFDLTSLADTIPVKPTTLTEHVEYIAMVHVAHFSGLIDRGMANHTNLTQADSLSAFSHLMKADPVFRSLDSAYDLRSKSTKKVLYWLYQSSFFKELPESERVRL